MQQGYAPAGPEMSWGGRWTTLDFCSNTFTTGDRLVLRIDQPNDPDCLQTLLYWNSSTNDSRVTVPTMPSSRAGSRAGAACWIPSAG